jgi:uncharacterized delta-60 repeat protein
MFLGPGGRALVLAAFLVLLLAGSGVAAPGDLDPHFGTGGVVMTDVSPTHFSSSVGAVALQPDGKIVAGGDAVNSGQLAFALARYNANGTLDSSFGTGGQVITAVGTSDVVDGLALQPDGKIVAAGYATNATNDFAVVRYNANGTLDGTFGSGGKVTTDVTAGQVDLGNAVALQPDGKIVVVGSSFNGTDNDFAVVRYNANGSLDGTFGSGGKVITPVGPDYDVAAAVALQPDGKIVVGGASDGGSTLDFAVLRYNTNGSLDGSFGSGGKVLTPVGPTNAQLNGLALQPDGRIVAVGIASSPTDFALVRYNANGSLDGSFGSGGKVTTDVTPGQSDAAWGVAVQPDGGIVAVGETQNDPSPEDFAVVRYAADGSLDGSFASGGIATTDLSPGQINEAHAVAVQPDGQIVVAGRADTTHPEFGLVRYLGWGLLVLPGHVGPGGAVTVRGQGFYSREAVDLYLDTTDLVLAGADSTGSFHANLTVPPATAPGLHWVSAVGRTSGLIYQASVQVGSDWPMFQFGPTHSGVNPFEGSLSPGNAAGVHVLWRAPLGTSGTHQAPAESGGLVYAVGSSGAVYAVDGATGKQAWASTALPSASPPAVDANAVVVSSAGYAYGLDPGTGEQRWSRNLSSGTGGPATIVNGVAYLGTTGGKVWAISTATGAKLASWTVYTAGAAVGGAPAVADGVVYFGASDGKVYALDATTGAPLAGWPVTAAPSASFVSSPAVDAGSLLIGGQDGNLYALDAETGNSEWTAPLGGATTSSPSVANGTVWIGANDGKLYAFDDDSGTLLYSSQALGGQIGSSPALANGVAFVTVQSRKKLIALNAATGAKLRSITTKSNPSSAIVANGDVYVSGTAGLQALGLTPPHAVARPDGQALVPDPRLG